MEIYQFKKEAGKKIEKFNSDFIMSRIIQTQKVAHIGCMHLDENGIIHQSTKWRCCILEERRMARDQNKYRVNCDCNRKRRTKSLIIYAFKEVTNVKQSKSNFQ
ncbi:hypothetical protein [Bacillus cereus]|uniref:Uncharacterized protein n=1 Tax=Bacillus cereus HuA4-10 TaxID=1053206 RepID=J8D354_BACCE|nr:hypothetical protein IGC_05800 [Bacillus cereus HuA4-10]